jgi:putative hemolysin
MTSLYVTLFAISLLMAALFCTAETSFVGLQKLRLKHLVESNNPRAIRVAKIAAHPEKFLATVLIGINFFETAMATLGTVLAIELWNTEIGAAVATVLVTILTLILAEVIPKNLASAFGERIALRIAPAIELTSIILYPFVWVLSRIGMRFQHLSEDSLESRPTLTEAEMQTAITVGEQEGIIKEDQADMLHQILRFKDRPVQDIMTPRTETVWLKEDLTVGDFLVSYADHPHTRFPIFHESNDNVVGILSIKDVLVAHADAHLDESRPIRDFMRPAHFVPVTKPLGDLLTEMREQNRHLAIVINEHGGVAGIITLEQVIEEIVGDIKDELSSPDEDIVPIDESNFKLDGALRIDEANDQLQLGLPSGNYTTVAGFILAHLGHLPRAGEQLKYHNLRLTINRMEGLKIEEILVTREKDAATTL